MATSGTAPTRRFHSPMRVKPLRRKGHRLEDGRIDRPERDIVGLERERALELGLVMRRDAELDARPADGRDVGAVEIALAEMHPGRALADGDAPVVVDDERRAGLAADRERLRASRERPPPRPCP